MQEQGKHWTDAHIDDFEKLKAEIVRLEADNVRLAGELEGIAAYEELGPGVNLCIADASGYEEMYWLWHEVDHGGDGLIYTGKTLLEACQKFESKKGGVDHP